MPKFEMRNIIVEAFQITYDVAAGKSPTPHWVQSVKIKWLYDSSFIFYTEDPNKIGSCNDWVIKDDEENISIEENEIFTRDYTEIIEYVLTQND